MPKDGWDLTDELVDMGAVEPIRRVSEAERTRRALMVVSGIVLGLLLVANLGCALALSAVKYALVGGVLGFAQSVAAAILASATTYYFTRK